MLVVIMIVVLLTSALVPVLSSASDARRAREGARIVSTVLASAETQRASQRPAGGRLYSAAEEQPRARSRTPAAAMDLFMCEVPPPYLGDALNSTASVMGGTVTFTAANLSNANVQTGDLIRFSYRGEFYQLTGSSGSWMITPLDQTLIGTPQGLPPGGNLPFQIFRRPVKTSAAPVQLTDGVAIDMNFSGVDFNTGGTNFNYPLSSVSGDIIITFSPTGARPGVRRARRRGRQRSRSVRFPACICLVGKIEKTQTPAGTNPTQQNQYPFNWQDPDCRWVGVNRQTGLVTTSEVATSLSGGAGAANVITSLRYARGSQNMVGN